MITYHQMSHMSICLIKKEMIVLLFYFLGMDFRRCLVLGLAGCRRMDVHCINPEPLRHLPRPLRRCNAAGQLS